MLSLDRPARAPSTRRTSLASSSWLAPCCVGGRGAPKSARQIVAGGGDVGDDQVQALGGTGCCGGDILAEDDRASGVRRRELDHAEVVTVVIVGIEPPPEPPVELLCAVDIRDGDDDPTKA
jgi:hypothetical protein